MYINNINNMAEVLRNIEHPKHYLQLFCIEQVVTHNERKHNFNNILNHPNGF